jgi:fumarate hydratase subunit alpha
VRLITETVIKETIKELLLQTNVKLSDSFLCKLKEALKEEKSELGKNVIKQIIKNNEIASSDKVPLCQDTGMVVVFVELGNKVYIDGDIYKAINEGVKEAYTEGYLRKSVVKHPLDRVNTNDNTPAITHIKITQGDKLKLTVAAKGGGSENMSLVKMLTPADGVEGIKKLVLETIFHAGGKPCPPLTIGIGIGGNLEKSALLAKEALMREIDDINPDPILKKLEEELLEEINKLGVGPMGFGGTITALGVKIKTYPTHIASLPVAINIQCHANRHISKEI